MKPFVKLKTSIFFVFCLLIAPGVIAQNTACDSLAVVVSEISSILCPGGEDGELSVEASGGVGPYQYLWNTGETTSTVLDLSAGTYSVNVIDANQCFTVGFYFLLDPESANYSYSVVNADCDTGGGSISIETPGDNGPYQFGINGGVLQPESQFTDLQTGVYAVRVVDADDCTAINFVSVNADNSFESAIELSQSNLCHNDCEAALMVVSPDSDLHYSWFSVSDNGDAELIGEGSSQAGDLCVGNYFVCADSVSPGVGGSVMPVTFWTENFGTGCNQGQLANGFNGANGAWTTTATGANSDFSNTFFVSATEQIGLDNCGTGCGGDNNRTLHVSNVAILFVPADGGALYLSDFATNRRTESPVIDCSGYENIELSFDYIEYGHGDLDNATLWYYDGSSWSQIDDPAKTACCGGPCDGTNQGSFTGYSIALPASANNNPNVRIGFNWTNNADSQGSDPSFAVDNIELTGVADDPNGDQLCAGCSEVFQVTQPDAIALFLVKFGNVTCYGAEDGAIQVQAIGGSAPYEYFWSNDSTTSQLSNLGPGSYTVTVTDQNGCQFSETYEITEPAEEWVGFEAFDLGLDVVFTNISSSGNYLWDFGDDNESTDANPSYTYEETGIYEVCLTLLSECGDLTTCQDLTIILTNLDDNQNTPLFGVFPNPVNDLLWFVPGNERSYSVQVFNTSGQMIHDFRSTKSHFVDVTQWGTGMYFYAITDDSGAGQATGKIIVTR